VFDNHTVNCVMLVVCIIMIQAQNVIND